MVTVHITFTAHNIITSQDLIKKKNKLKGRMCFEHDKNILGLGAL